jgi:hypothetical protein
MMILLKLSMSVDLVVVKPPRSARKAANPVWSIAAGLISFLRGCFFLVSQ